MGIGAVTFVFWPHCDRAVNVLATDSHGQSIISCFEACRSLGTTLAESIELKSASGKRTSILEYAPDGGTVGCLGRTFPTNREPVVDWSDPRVIHISISVIASIFKQYDTVNGVKVTYDIGSVISTDCGIKTS